MKALTCPPQTTPIGEPGEKLDLDAAGNPVLRFDKTWWLFFWTLTSYALNGVAMAQFGTHAQRLALAVKNVPSGAVFFESDTGLSYQLRSGAWAFAGGTQVVDQILAAASTTINGPTTGAIDLVEIVRQDGTGGRAVVWGVAFSGASVSLGAAVANSIATFRFVLSGGKYVQVGQQTVDML